MHRLPLQLPLGDVYVPPSLRDPRAFAAFSKDLVNAVTCCELVEQNPWTAQTALEVIMKAQRMSSQATVRAVSPPSEGCSQRFRVFEAEEDGQTTFIVAFRSDQECYNDMVKKSKEFSVVEKDIDFQVHQGLWSRVATMPLRSLPPQWRSQLHQGRHRLLLTGFSVGGAVAALATLQLLQSEDPDLREKICCYTFGTPLQGNQDYADCINYRFSSNFYHVIIDGDVIPGVLTLVNKVAENQPVLCSDVVTSICMMLALVTEVATYLILETTLPGSARAMTAILQQIDTVKLETGIKSLIRTEGKSRTSLPEYKFGGSLVQLNRQQSNNGMTFIRLPGDGRVLEGIFSVDERKVASSDLKSNLGIHQIKTFRQLINGLDNSYINQVLKDASVDHSDIWTPPEELSELRLESPTRCTGQQPAEKDDRHSSSYLLQPYFDVQKPIQVWLHKDGNITIEVYGKNMAFGIHVLYLINGKEILRVPCTENRMPPRVENSEGSLMSLKKKMENMPLQFNTQGIKDLSLDDEKGCFIVQLAFGSQNVPAKKVNKSWNNSMDTICVAERFAKLHPTKLIDLLLFWGTATAQALCTTAYYAIQEHLHKEHRELADADVQKILEMLQNVPPEFRLLDKLLLLLDTRQISPSTLNKLPPKMSETLSKTTNDTTSKLLVPYFSAGNESSEWTFSGCYTRTIKRMITKEMLSEKETAEQLSKVLDTELAGPKEMVLAYLDHQFKYKRYAKEFSFKRIIQWEKEKRFVTETVQEIFGIRNPDKESANVTEVVIRFPVAMQASPSVRVSDATDSEVVKALHVVLGLPIAALSAGMVVGAWWLYHAVSAPRRVIQNRPGLINELQLTSHLAENWEKKLQAAAYLFNCKIEPPSVACKWEFELYQFLIDRIPEAGCFDFSSQDVQQVASISSSRFRPVTFLQLTNLAIAGARVHEFRKHLTERHTALGLIGTSQAGKSTFAKNAFHVDSKPGSTPGSRTRVMRYWTCPLPRTAGRDRQFTLIDFPGSNDYTAQDCYIRGQSLARVIVVVFKLDEMNTAQGVTLIRKACEVKRQDTEVHILVCLTKADEKYRNYQDEAEDNNTTAAQLFTESFEYYKRKLLSDSASETAGDADHLAYISANMHACCFKPSLQNENIQLARELMNVNVKNVAWVKNWCVDKLSIVDNQ